MSNKVAPVVGDQDSKYDRGRFKWHKPRDMVRPVPGSTFASVWPYDTCDDEFDDEFDVEFDDECDIEFDVEFDVQFDVHFDVDVPSRPIPRPVRAYY